MSPRLNSTLHNEQMQSAARMAEGLGTHKGEENFPPHLNDAALRQQMDGVQESRVRYEKSAAEAQQAYDDYAAKMKALEQGMVKSRDVLRGFYGRSNPVLMDFGMEPAERGTRRRNSKGKANGSADQAVA